MNNRRVRVTYYSFICKIKRYTKKNACIENDKATILILITTTTTKIKRNGAGDTSFFWAQIFSYLVDIDTRTRRKQCDKEKSPFKATMK